MIVLTTAGVVDLVIDICADDIVQTWDTLIRCKYCFDRRRGVGDRHRNRIVGNCKAGQSKERCDMIL